MKCFNYEKNVSIDEIMNLGSGKTEKKLVLIEGAPGIGKSTLAWEMCRQWDTLPCMADYNLVILLSLREKRSQSMGEILDLFIHCNVDKQLVANEVLRSHGEGVLFILDGFDELPVPLQHEGIFVDLINKAVLPESMVVVTSRPSATAQLLTSCRPLIWKHIEILGFTQQSVEAYAASVISDGDEVEHFKRFISTSKSPAINSLMYVPINAAIIVQIYLESESKSTLPQNLTELYTQLCLTILNRYIKTKQPSVSVKKFKNLPDDLHKQFLELSRIAFEGMENQKLIFNSEAVPSNLDHFGFLDAVSSLYGGGEISYNFLHLTLQEFFAAYYISQLPDSGAMLFTIYGEDERWKVVWKFVYSINKVRFIGE